VTVPKAAWTAGTSPYTFAAQPFDATFVITTVGGMTALTLDGQAIFNGSFSVGQQVSVSCEDRIAFAGRCSRPLGECQRTAASHCPLAPAR
jgi:hypothetical protein